jgi:hypothetical protein
LDGTRRNHQVREPACHCADQQLRAAGGAPALGVLRRLVEILGRFERRQTKKKDNQGNLKTDANGEIATYFAKTWSDADEKGLGVRCIGRLKGETEPRITELLMAQAITRNSTLWVEDPRQQIGYLSGFRWGRLHTPEAIMGIYTPEEDFEPPRDMGTAEVVQPKVDAALLKAGEEAAAKGRAAYTEFWKHVHAPAARDPERADRPSRALQGVRPRRPTTSAPSTPAPAAPTPTPTPAPSPTPRRRPAGRPCRTRAASSRPPTPTSTNA